MDKIIAKQLNKAIEEALQPVALKFGLTLENRGGRFSECDYKPSITFVGKSDNGDNRLEIAWKKYAVLYGLKPEWLGEIVNYRSGAQIIIGIDVKKSKYPVVLEDNQKKRYIATAESIIAMLTLQERNKKADKAGVNGLSSALLNRGK